MKSRRRPSKKPSAASSTAAKRLESTVFYLDESIYSRALYQRMVELGARGWVALTRDRNIRRRALEVRAIRESRAAVFVFITGEARSGETADSVARLLRRFVSIAASEPRPFIRTFGLGNAIGRVKLRR